MIRAGNLAAWLLHKRAMEAAIVEDANDHGFGLSLVDIGVPESWSPRFAETVEEMDVNQQRLVKNFRYYVVIVSRGQVTFCHSHGPKVAAGIFDRMALMYECEGRMGGYLAITDPNIVPQEVRR
jgi:hypothetical protein